LANRQLAIVLRSDVRLQTILQFPSKAIDVHKIDAAIHVAEAVGGTNYGVYVFL
jgi:hypothetical protein